MPHSILKNFPKVIAHRGASGCAPENTLVAMKKAHELGATWVEFDVTLTADGEAIVFHDVHLQRTTNGRGNVNEHTYAKLCHLDAGNWFSPKFVGERIPKLTDLLRYLQALHLSANLEIKPAKGQEIATAQKVVEILNAKETAKIPLLISSFSLQSLLVAKEALSQYPFGLLLDSWDKNWEATATLLDCYSIHLNQRILSPKRAMRIKSAGFHLLSYTVNNPLRAKQLWEWGVDAVFSNFPDRMLKVSTQ